MFVIIYLLYLSILCLLRVVQKSLDARQNMSVTLYCHKAYVYSLFFRCSKCIPSTCTDSLKPFHIACIYCLTNTLKFYAQPFSCRTASVKCLVQYSLHVSLEL